MSDINLNFNIEDMDLDLDLDLNSSADIDLDLDLDLGRKPDTAPKPSSGSIEQDCAEELKEMENAFKDRAQAEERRKIKSTDSEYWVCLCFQTREEVEEFIRKTGWAKPDQKYIDGRKAAKAMNITLESLDNSGYGKVKVDKTYAAMSARKKAK